MKASSCDSAAFIVVSKHRVEARCAVWLEGHLCGVGADGKMLDGVVADFES